jgi:hypothetical protein
MEWAMGMVCLNRRKSLRANGIGGRKGSIVHTLYAYLFHPLNHVFDESTAAIRSPPRVVGLCSCLRGNPNIHPAHANITVSQERFAPRRESSAFDDADAVPC